MIVAMDHLVVMPYREPGLADIPKLTVTIREAGADAVLVTQGALREAGPHLGDLGVIFSAPLAADSASRVPETALACGADMVKVLVYPFTPDFADASNWLMALTSACRRWDLPVMAETVPGGFAAEPAKRETDAIVSGARIAFELGASVIKTPIPIRPGSGQEEKDDLDGLRLLCDYLPVPVVVLGGDPVSRSVLNERIAGALAAGVAGVAAGRNVWSHDDPAARVSLLSEIVHRGHGDPPTSEGRF
jgi:DhnA family fructose-bisphosphate aldolase class Ia